MFAKLTYDLVYKEIFNLLKEGNLSQRDIAARYNISLSAIMRLKQGRTYKYINRI
jgi:transcriptional regulator with XRE-family HTH domain